MNGETGTHNLWERLHADRVHERERESLIGEPWLQFSREQLFGEPDTLPPHDWPVTTKDGTVIKPKAKRGSVLEDAITTVNGPRQDTYGNPEDSFERIANLWGGYLGGKYGWNVGITAQDVALMMSLMKIARMMTGAGQRDSYVDACGYIALAADMQGGE